MDLRQLEIFRAVATTGSLSRAADTLHIAQPALSRQVRALELALATPLFVRTGRGMALTEAGHELLQQSTGIMDEVRRLQDSIRSFDGVPRGDVVIGCVPTVGERVAGPLAEQVIGDYPDISLRLLEGYSGHLIDWMHRGDLDAAIIYVGDERPHVEIEEIGRETMLAVGSPGQWPGAAETLTFETFAGTPISLPGEGHGLRSIVDAAAAARGIELDVVLEADSYRVLLDIVDRGLATTVLPASALIGRGDHYATARLVDPELTRSLAIATPVGATQTRAITAVLDVLRRLTRDLIASA